MHELPGTTDYYIAVTPKVPIKMDGDLFWSKDQKIIKIRSGNGVLSRSYIKKNYLNG